MFGATLYGVTGRDFVDLGNTGVSDLSDAGLFFQDRMEFSPKASILFGARLDGLWDHSHDPLDCAADLNFTCMATNGLVLPADHSTGTYGLGNANVSGVYKFTPNLTGYLTFDWTQSPPNPNGGEGGINLYGQVPDSVELRASSYLYEAGLKANLLDNRLFISSAVFDQKHVVPAGAGSTQSLSADTFGLELEANYQPTRNLFATASYSYVRTRLASPPVFYDFPAQPGLNVDGAPALLGAAMFLPNQPVDQPDQPQHLFNALGNYKFSNGIGLRSGVQVTAPISLTASALVDTGAIEGLLGALPNSVTQIAPGVG